MINTESRHWGPARPVTSEYSTHSESKIKVYNYDQLISSTHDGVRAYSNSMKTVHVVHIKTRMCANAQHDGCPAEYRWRPLFNAADAHY